MKKVLNFLIPAVAVLLAVTVVVTGIFFDSIFGKTDWFIEKSQTADVKLTVKSDKNGEVLDGFGASVCLRQQEISVNMKLQ